jgi:hypothetical protein
MVARTSGIIDVDLLIKYLDKFSKQEQSSIAQQIRDKVELSTLKEDISFDLKKYLVKTNKVKLDSNKRLYVTKDNQSIVLLTLGDNIKIGLYTEDDYYPNIKLNQRTSKYLLEYPELDKIPLKNLIKLAEDNVVSKEFVGDVLDKAKKEITLPLFCPCCSNLMKHKQDKLFYIQYKRCFNCQIEFETDIRKMGLWEEYEKNIINSDLDHLISNYSEWINEIINSSDESFITESGDIEKWIGSSKKKLLENKEETIKYLQSLKKH